MNLKSIKVSFVFFMMICFLLPFVTISCQGQEISTINGYELVIGKTIEEQGQEDGIGPNPLLIGILIAMIALIILVFIGSPRFNFIGVILNILCIIMLIMFKVIFTQKVEECGFQADYEIGYWLTLAVSIVNTCYWGYLAFFNKDTEYINAEEYGDYHDNNGEQDIYPYIIGLSGYYGGSVIEVGYEVINIGRDSEVCQLVYPQSYSKVSRKHCSIRFDFEIGKFILEDYSTNGTFVDSKNKDSQIYLYELEPGSQFYIASREELYEVRLER